MSQIDAKKLIAYLEEKWKERPCPMCGVDNWSVQDKAYEVREFHEGDLVVGSGLVIPVIPVVCTNCGNTVFVNAILAGVVEPDKEEKK